MDETLLLLYNKITYSSPNTNVIFHCDSCVLDDNVIESRLFRFVFA